MQTRVAVLVVLVLLGRCDRAFPQHWIFDAREIALGATGRDGIVSADMIETGRPDTSVVLPFGLLQIFRDPAIYDSSSRDFDPVRAVEYASAPFHYILGRATSDSAGSAFVSDVRHAIVARDLSTYRGFSPVSGRLAEAVASSMGYIVRGQRADHRPSHGVYIGAGPYLSVETSGTVDPRLSSVLNGSGDARNTELAISDTDQAQVALALTVGYRGRFPWPAGVVDASTRDGVYVGANYNYIRGFLYEHDSLNMRLDTDAAGLLVDSSNLSVQHGHASHGAGFSLDLGTSVVVGRWEVGVGANGVLNRIDWNGLNVTTYSLASVTSGTSDFVQITTIAGVDRRVVLPVEYRGTVRYTANDWSATMGVGDGFSGVGFHGGVERRFERFDLRGGGHYRFGAWNPSGGLGFPVSRRLSLDVAVFGTNANIERTRQMGIAASVRIRHPAP